MPASRRSPATAVAALVLTCGLTLAAAAPAAPRTVHIDAPASLPPRSIDVGDLVRVDAGASADIGVLIEGEQSTSPGTEYWNATVTLKVRLRLSPGGGFS